MITFGTNLEPFVALTSEKHPDDIPVESDALYSLNWKIDPKIVIVQHQPNPFCLWGKGEALSCALD